MNENVNKKQFVKQIDRVTRPERVIIANELYEVIKPRLVDERIPGYMRSHIAQVWNQVRTKQRISSANMWQLWVMAMKPVGDLKNWRMTGKQCYRLQPKTTQFPYTRPRTTQTRTRRETIRDCNGDAVPRRWLDKFAPHVKTQADWDANSIYRSSK